jgi:hypothetical protein
MRQLRAVVGVYEPRLCDGGRGVSTNLGHPTWVAYFLPLLSLFDRAMILRG